MQKPEHIRCENCVFFNGFGKDGYGICYRYPPVPVETPQRLVEGIAAIYSAVNGLGVEDDRIQEFLEPGHIREYSCLPKTERGSWCGEFKAEWPA